MKVAIVGAGWYGCHLAMILHSHGVDVDIYDSNKSLFDGASGRNQNRLHNGFHYPRDAMTRKQSLEGYYYFLDVYPNLIENIDNNIYAISAKNSLIDFETYKLIMKNSGCDYEEVDFTFLNQDIVSGAIRTNEKLIKTNEARNYFSEILNRSNVNVELEYTADPIEIISKSINSRKYDYVINATWGAIQTGLLNRYELFYEPCIYFYYSSYDGNTDFALTMMDGRLFSLFPYQENIYTLTSVQHTPIVKTKHYITALNVLNDVNAEFANERKRLFEELTCLYMPEFLEQYKYEGVELSLKTKVLSDSDSRYCIIEEANGVIDIFSGKIDTIKYAEDRVLEIMGLDL